MYNQPYSGTGHQIVFNKQEKINISKGKWTKKRAKKNKNKTNKQTWLHGQNSSKIHS